MKGLNSFVITILILSVFVLIFSILDFVSLTDIKNEYVSQDALTNLNITLSESLPEWTSTPGEWRVVAFSLFLRSLFFVLNFIVILRLYKIIKLSQSK